MASYLLHHQKLIKPTDITATLLLISVSNQDAKCRCRVVTVMNQC